MGLGDYDGKIAAQQAVVEINRKMNSGGSSGGGGGDGCGCGCNPILLLLGLAALGGLITFLIIVF